MKGNRLLFGCVLGIGLGCTFLAPRAYSDNHWQRYDGNPIVTVMSSYADVCRVIKDGATYKMWYTDGASNWQIYLRESDDGFSWGSPTLVMTRDKPWEGAGLSVGAVVRDELGYHMWYNSGDFSHVRVFLAHSTDGVHWTKHVGPVLGPRPGMFDSSNVWASSVLRENGLYRMWYGVAPAGTSAGVIGYAESHDGFNWVRFDEPVLEPIGGTVFSQAVASPWVVHKDGKYTMFLVSSADYTGHIGHVTSSDGVNWETDDLALDLSPAPDSLWEDTGVSSPCVVPTDGRVLLYYVGNHGLRTNPDAIGVAYNCAPIANGGEDRGVPFDGAFAGLTEVFLDGTGSWDPESDPLAFQWHAPDGVIIEDPANPVTAAYFPCGASEVILAVSDGLNSPVTDSVLVTVRDETDPVVDLCLVTPATLWPPNHQMVDVTIVLKATDNCVAPNDLIVVCHVQSDEPDDGTGDGAFTGDVDGQDGYASPVTVNLGYDAELTCWVGTASLRAERDGKRTGRTYSVTCDVWDSLGGNMSRVSRAAIVPHDVSKKR